MLLVRELTTIGFNIFLMLGAITINDINILAITILLFGIAAADTALGVTLLLLSKREMNNIISYIQSL